MIEQRVVILSNAAQLLDKAITLDKETLTQIAAYRGGVNPNADGDRTKYLPNLMAFLAKLILLLKIIQI